MHKTNVLTFAGDLWQRTFNEVAAEYPDVAHRVQPRRRGVHLLRRRTRGRYDVIVTDNLFGDILTDLGGAVARRHRPGRVGQPQPGPHRPVACSSRCTARRPTSPAPGKADPRAAVISAAMMRDFLGEADAVGPHPEGRRHRPTM